MYTNPAIKAIQGIALGGLLILICWLYFRLRITELSAQHLGDLSGVPSMLLASAESWARDEDISVDQVRKVDSDFLDILYGSNRPNHAYIVGFDRSLITSSHQRYTIVIDGDGDGLYMGIMPLSARVALISEDIQNAD